MIRRIAAAILLVTWTALLVAGVAAHVATRRVLLADLDASIAARAALLPEVLGIAPAPGQAVLPDGDRYVVRDPLGRTVARPSAPQVTPRPAGMVRLVHAATTALADGRRMRTVTLSIDTGRPPNSGPLVVTYSTSAERADRLLDRLDLSLVAVGVGCAIGSALAVRWVSRLAIQPLTRAADVIGAIDERQLDRRLDAAALPVELRPMADRLNGMLARLERAFADRRRFLADASHELRTPVAALVTTIEVALRRPRETAALTDALRTSLVEASALRHLVEQLTRQVRSGSAEWDEPVQRFDAAALLNACADAVEPAASERQIAVARRLPDRLPVETQPGRLRSIVTNLLANAVEYGRDGGHVELRCDVGPELAITVADDGPGIAPDLVPKLFEPFTRGVAARGPADAHLGLGLSILNGHVRSLGGRCEVDSVVGAGTRFRVLLPGHLALAPPDARPAVPV